MKLCTTTILTQSALRIVKPKCRQFKLNYIGSVSIQYTKVQDYLCSFCTESEQDVIGFLRTAKLRSNIYDERDGMIVAPIRRGRPLLVEAGNAEGAL